MSYDLFFTSPNISRSEFDTYFGNRSNYEVGNGEAFYSSEYTGVYFSFDHHSEPPDDEEEFEYSASFNINFYRPHYFALEAEPEVRRFIDHFNCSIYDPQNSGMSEGPYSRDGFLNGWNNGNEFAYSAILGREDMTSGTIWTKPTDELERIWRWNAAKETREQEIDEDIFIPRIMLMAIDGELGSVSVWPDAISTIIPDVDFLYVPRSELAPKRFLKKQEDDFCIVANKDFPEFFDYYAADDLELKTFRLPAPDTPKMIKDYVRDLHPFEGEVEGIGNDSVLNRELVERYRQN